ncbi:MAG TPA: Gfo/Idh/MocA family oxidoreductase, partial [Armatimonadota bacterium]|nr:Gfo/Idh/MocA family oxidoreductase [Armatimonadota bacterium]
MIKVGIVGLGGISAVHLDAYSKVTDKAMIIARCDKIRERAEGTAQGITINIGGGGTATQLKATPYTDYRQLLADPEVELVDVCLPTDLHAEVSIAALEAGKHVLCEKPMARTIEQCDNMIAAAKASGKTFMIAHCIRFWPEYVYLKELVDSGKYGKLVRADFSRLSAPPRWSSENWLMTPSRSGSSHLDMHIHDTDFIIHLLGMPKQVITEG